jgi:UDP-N-acetylmuramoyl-L-alanyl-D-glutamate--2,6-diaminopimelate ligase
MGRIAVERADVAIVTDDNPRSEDPLAIIEEIKPGLSGNNYQIIPDRAEAIKVIMQSAKPGDMVLLAGKGAEEFAKAAQLGENPIEVQALFGVPFRPVRQ